MKTIKLIAASIICLLCISAFSLNTGERGGKAFTAGETCTREKAQLCNGCGFGSKKDNCVKCNKWVASSGSQAYLCGDCSFGSKKDNCVKCNKWVGSSGVKAQLCSDCSFGSKKDNCSKCNKWMGS